MWHLGECGEPIDRQEEEDAILYGRCDGTRLVGLMYAGRH